MLRDEIGRMAGDGTLAGIDFRWHTSLGTEVGTIFEFDIVRYCVRALLAVLAVRMSAVLGMFWLTRRFAVDTPAKGAVGGELPADV
jgi:hypothetical protein